MRRLTQLFLVSSCLISSLPTAVLGAPQSLAASAPIDADGKAEGVIFTAPAVTLTVPTGSNIGSTAGVSAKVNGAFLPTIVFQGTSIVTGSISAAPLPPAAGNRVKILELQGGGGTSVTLNGVTALTDGASQINFTTLAGATLNVNQNLFMGIGGEINFKDKGTGSTVIFDDGVNFSGAVLTDNAGEGSVKFLGSSTVTDGLLGSNNALLDVQLGSGTVYLNNGGVNPNQAVTFKFTSNTGTNTLKLADGAKITGAITTNTAGAGTIVFEKDSAIIGNVGTLAKPLSLIQMSNVNSTVTLTGDVYANTLQFLNAGANENTLNLSSAGTSTVKTNIITATNGKGILDLTKVGIFIGDIGSSTNKLNQVLVGANNDTAVTGNIHVTGGVAFQSNNKELTIADGNFINGSVIGFGGGGGILTFLGSSQSFGQIGDTNDLAEVNFNGGTFNLNNSPVGADDVTVRNGATLVFNQPTTLSGNLNLDATGANLQLGNNEIKVGVNLVTNNNTDKVTFDLKSSTVFGKLTVTNQATIDAPVFKITTSGFIPNNTDLKIVTAGGGVVIGGGGPATLENTSTLLSNFTLTHNPADITLTVTRNTNTSVAEFPFTLGVAGALDVIQNNPPIDPDIFAVLDQLDNFTNAADFNRALASLAPSVDGDGFEGIMALTRLGVQTVRERLDNYRLGQLDYLHTGYSASSYNALKDYGVWTKLLASRLKQEEYRGIEGYKSDIYGIAAGIDYTSPDDVVVYGLGFNYASTETLSRAQAASTNEISSYSLMLYGTYNFPNPWYVDGILYLSQHDYEQTRNIRVGAVSGSAKSKYEAWQISARAETGFVYQYNKVLFQPILALFYSHLDRDDFTDEGAGGLNLVNRPRDINSLRLSVGPKISSVLGSEGASLIPEIHAYYNFELLNSKEQFLSNFVVGGPTFQTDGIEPKRSSYIVGMALSAYGFENVSCHVGLDYEINETKFSAFHGSLKFKYTW